MAIVQEGIVLNDDTSLSFGNYMVKEKIKVKDFEVDGALYSVKTHNEVTRLERNGKLLVECIPGASFFGFRVSEAGLSCLASGLGDSKITMELAPETEYEVSVDGSVIGTMKSTISGKISFSVELSENGREIKVIKH